MADDQDVSDQEILAVFANVEETPLRLPEVAEILPIDRDDLGDRLDDLTERGLLEGDDDPPATTWDLAPGAADEITIPDEEVETRVEAQASRATGTETPPLESETADSPPPEPGEAAPGGDWRPPEDAIESFDPPGTPEQADQRREALRRAYAYLREHGSADREAFASEVFPEAPGAYEEPDDGWWDRVVRPGLAGLPDVEEPATAGGEWRFVDESGTAGESGGSE